MYPQSVWGQVGFLSLSLHLCYISGSQPGVIPPRQGHWAVSGDIFVVITGHDAIERHLRGREPRVAVLFLQCTEQALATGRRLVQRIGSAEAERPCSKLMLFS